MAETIVTPQHPANHERRDEVSPSRRQGESDLTVEDREAAEAVGYFKGMNHKFGLEVEDRARELLHEQAREMFGFARRLAATKGPAWEAMIVWSCADDE